MDADEGAVAGTASSSTAKRRRGMEDACTHSETAQGSAATAQQDSLATAEVDAAYFNSYDELSVHALMLGDASRVGAYAAAFRLGRAALHGRTVLDVGAGSGVLSLLAARLGGAARVYAVEAAPGMASLARRLAAANGLDDVMRVVEGRAEEVELPEQVDVIISEWMGFYLLHESMLEAVLAARNRWLKPGGIMLPSSARIWAVLAEAEGLRMELESYQCLHGLDLSIVAEAELARRCREPEVELLESQRLLAQPLVAWECNDFRNLRCGATAELSVELSFVALRTGRAAALALWFDVGFAIPTKDQPCGKQVVELSTGPGAPATHWKQTVVHLGCFVPVEAGDVLPVRLLLRQSGDNPRQYEITVESC